MAKIGNYFCEQKLVAKIFVNQKVSSQKFVFTLISPGETSAPTLIEIERGC
jgi:hypothetical protein